MTEHLPECAVSEDAGEGNFTSWMIDECICDRLRACEARVTAAAVQRVGALFWFSDIAMRDQTHPDDYPWQPCLQLDGMCLSLGIWFASKDECDQFILSDVVRVGWKS